MTKQNTCWSLTLPAALLMMAPFDILASLAMDIYLPVVPSMPVALKTDSFLIQLTLSLYMVVLGVGQLIFGPISDRAGRRPVLLAGTAIFTAASLAASLSLTGTQFLVSRIFQGIGASAALVATFATVRDIYANRAEGSVVYGMLSSILAFVPAVGPIFGAIINEQFGWRAIFLMLAVLGATAGLHAAFKWPETRPSRERKDLLPICAIWKSRSFWVYTLAFSAAMGTFFVFFSTAPRILIGRANFTEFGFSITFASVAAVMILTSQFGKTLVSRCSIAKTTAIGMSLLIAGALCLMIGEKGAVPSFTTFIVPMWVAAAGIVITVSVTANGALQEFDENAGSAVALYFCIQSLIVGVFGTAAVATFGGNTVWPIIGYAGAMAILVLIGLATLRCPLGTRANIR